MFFLRFVAVLALGLSVGACGSAIDNAPINVAMTSAALAGDGAASGPNLGETAVGLSFSGGGTRAAAFAQGVLEELASQRLRDGTSLADRVAFVSGVSGGSVAAAYFAYHGPRGIPEFRQRFLLQDVEAALRTGITPANLLRAYEGGVNDREGLPRWLDRNLFGGATYGELRRRGGPVLWVNASDIYNRNVFIFDDWTFSVICSDLSQYPLSEAVAASAAVPIAFAPITIRNYADRCPYREPPWVRAVSTNRDASSKLRAYADALQRYRKVESMPQISLLDGGITDNLGVYGLTIARGTAENPYQPLSRENAVRLRNMLFVVVDAGRGPEGNWPTQPGGPTGTQVAQAAVDTMIDSNIRYTYDAFKSAMETWRADLVRYRCSLSESEVQALRGSIGGWDCRDLSFHVVRIGFDNAEPGLRARLNAVPTSFKLAEEQVDLVIGSARGILQSDPNYREFLRRAN